MGSPEEVSVRESIDLADPDHRAAVGEFLARAELGFLYAEGLREVVGSNATAEELLDVDGGLVGVDPRDTDQSFGPELVDAIEAATRTDRTVDERAVLDDGTTLRFQVVPGSDGVVALVRDATEDFELRRELRRSNRILETLEDGVYTLNEAFVITSVTRRSPR